MIARILKAAALAAVAIVASLVVGHNSAHAQDYCGPYSRPICFTTTTSRQSLAPARAELPAPNVSVPPTYTAAGRTNIHHLSTARSARIFIPPSPFVLPR